VTIDDDIRLPESLEAAWGRRERPRRGPKPGLTLERIVAAAVNVAAADGLAAVSMNRVAKDLGTSAMSLYRYVAAKDELLALMVDSVLIVPPGESGEHWRAGLSRWARTYVELLRRHPWALRIPISGPPITPNQVGFLETGLRALGATGLTDAEKLSVILLVSGFVRNAATLEADLAAAQAASGSTEDVMPAYARLLLQLTDAERFPALHAAIASGAFDDEDDIGAEFDFGLERVLDGVEVLVKARG
jgi:AcrR family transcriptional regulator